MGHPPLRVESIVGTSPTAVLDAVQDPLTFMESPDPEDRAALVAAWALADLAVRPAFAGGPVKDACWRMASHPSFAWLPGGLRDEALRAYMEADQHATACMGRLAMMHLDATAQLETAMTTTARNLATFIEDFSDGDVPLVALSCSLVVSSLPSWPMRRAKAEPIYPALGAFADDCIDYDLRIGSYFRRVAAILAERLPGPLRVRFSELVRPSITFFLEQTETAFGAALTPYGASTPTWVAASHAAFGEYKELLVAAGQQSFDLLWAESADTVGDSSPIPTQSPEK